MNNFVLSVSDKASNHAGPKAKEDIVKFLGEKGYKNLLLHIPHSKISKIGYSFFELHRIFHNFKADTIAFQYPIYSLFLTKRIIKAIRVHTNAKLIIIIHDVESLRLFKDNSEHKKKEIDLFNMADGLIVHNRFMATWLRKHGVTTTMVNLEIFDYDNPQAFLQDRKYIKTVCFAGNLAKANFLAQVTLKEGLFVYGPNPAENYPTGVNYAGQYSPDELPKYLTQNFGLVWDGSSLAGCDGVFGHYMKYNNPHKVSLYLSSGLPVIVWQEAAIAEFVKKYKVGIVLENLGTLEHVLSHISEEEYKELQLNAITIGKKMRKGFYIQHAIEKLISNWS